MTSMDIVAIVGAAAWAPLEIGTIKMIPLQPNKEATLGEKQKGNFKNIDAAVFLLTGGCTRDEKSLTQEKTHDHSNNFKESYAW